MEYFGIRLMLTNSMTNLKRLNVLHFCAINGLQAIVNEMVVVFDTIALANVCEDSNEPLDGA